MIRFCKEVYLTGFAIVYRLSRSKDIVYKAGSAVGAITLIEWLIFIDISGYVEMFYGKNVLLSKPIVVVAILLGFLINGYFLFFRRHGVKFAHEFDRLGKTRKVALVISCAAIVVATIVFTISSSLAYRRFIGAH